MNTELRQIEDALEAVSYETYLPPVSLKKLMYAKEALNKLKEQADTSDLYDEIYSVWAMTEDFDTLLYAIEGMSDRMEAMDIDRLMNMVIGIRELLDVRVGKLMETYDV